MKNCPQQPFEPLMLDKMPNQPWKNIFMDKVLEYSRNSRAGSILVKKLLNKNLNDLTYKKTRSFRASKIALSLEVERIQYHVPSLSCKQANNIF